MDENKEKYDVKALARNLKIPFVCLWIGLCFGTTVVFAQDFTVN